MRGIDLELGRLGLWNGVGTREDGRAWLERLGRLVAELCDEWELRPGPAYGGGSGAWVAPVALADGTGAVLKVGYPHREARAEADGLRLWDGRGAVRLLRVDEERTAYLLERCEPAQKLAAADHIAPEQRLLIAAALLRRLWRPVEAAAGTRIESVAEQMGWWAGLAAERFGALAPGVDAGFVSTGISLLRSLPANAPTTVVLHGDCNPGNILSAAREPWLAIDAKPLTGDPAFDPWPLLAQIDDPFALPRPASFLLARGKLLADALGLDLARVFAWGAAKLVEMAVAEAADGDHGRCAELLAQARTVADLAGL
ncbi:MAG TPA: aminoglycoside phosphotransferase family protein [Actinospica sp.]|nr:aminoglycoside phosphotransferase family protein [Actinospica sp.]